MGEKWDSTMGEVVRWERSGIVLWEKWDDEREVGQYYGRSGTMREKWDSIVGEVGR